jgi:hypothetical protein
MVDSGMGLQSELAKLTTNPTVEGLISDLQLSTFDEDEEFGDVSAGENFVSRVVDAVLQSPAWPRTLLVWCYNEHGGYDDHVPPPAAVKPDSIPPALAPGDVSGAYDIYGPRVPAVVASPYSRPGGVSNVVYDHTSILATIEAKWNPACPHLSRRQRGNAGRFPRDRRPVVSGPARARRPKRSSGNAAQVQRRSDQLRHLPVSSYRRRCNSPASPIAFASGAPGPFAAGVVVVALNWTGRALTDVVVELEQGRQVLARSHLAALGDKAQ